MNTQAHLLLAAALFCRSSNVGPNTPVLANRALTNTGSVNLAVLIGALLPDVSLFLMFALARARGISNEIIWNELYYSAFWQYIGAITNSIPIYLALALAGFAFLNRAKVLASMALVTGLAALLHCLMDLPLHVDDGHAHFWPLTLWVYQSPVSYWDANHYANYWQPVEFVIASLSALFIWKRFPSVWVRIGTIIGVLTYPVMFAVWFYLMH